MEGEFKHIIRIAGKDLPGEKSVQMSLTKLRGVGIAYARAVAHVAGIDPHSRLGDLKEDQVGLLEKVLKNPISYGIPRWMVNRRKDYETGKDLHLIGVDVELKKKADIGRERRIRSRRGIRHELGLPVRGQRTRTTGRRGLTVGVTRRETRAQAEQAKEEEK